MSISEPTNRHRSTTSRCQACNSFALRRVCRPDKLKAAQAENATRHCLLVDYRSNSCPGRRSIDAKVATLLLKTVPPLRMREMRVLMDVNATSEARFNAARLQACSCNRAVQMRPTRSCFTALEQTQNLLEIYWPIYPLYSIRPFS